MQVDQWLHAATAQLKAAGIASARLDCLILLEDALGKDRSRILAHQDEVISQKTAKILEPLINKRAEHIPLSYIRHQTEFYGRTFYIDEHVLEPRPESEALIEELLYGLVLPSMPTIVDVGTGSGALAITAKLELLYSDVHAVDIDPQCLIVAERNAIEHKAAISFSKGDLLQGFDELSIDVVLANLPYVPDEFHINLAATHEPRIAIFGGADGLDLYRKMFEQISSAKYKPRYVLAESLPPQHPQLAKIAAQVGYQQELEQDFIQVFAARD